MHFLQFSKKKISQIFEDSPASGGFAPGTLINLTQKVSPNRNPGGDSAFLVCCECVHVYN